MRSPLVALVFCSLSAFPAFATPFHDAGLNLSEELSYAVNAGCSEIAVLPAPANEDPEYAALWDLSQDHCERIKVAYSLLANLSSEVESTRFQTAGYLHAKMTQVGRQQFYSSFSALGAADAPAAFSRKLSTQLWYMAFFDLDSIAEYATKFVENPDSLQNIKVADWDLSDRTIEGKVCYHSSFDNVDLSASVWSFSEVTRFCNFNSVKAIGATFRGWFYSQTFKNSDLKGSHFEFFSTIPSEVTFTKSNLQKARFSGNVSRLKFIDSDLKGASVNGILCSDEKGTDCLPSNH